MAGHKNVDLMRPPVKTARETATRALITAHQDEYNDLVDKYLAEAGWSQEIVEKKVWRQATEA